MTFFGVYKGNSLQNKIFNIILIYDDKFRVRIEEICIIMGISQI